MGAIKGANHYQKWLTGGKLTRMQAMRAMCYQCNGLEESNVNCQGKSCPLYPFQHYRGFKNAEKALSMDYKTNHA